MRLLAIDTSTPAVAVALHDGERALAERVVVDARRHGELVAPLVQEVLDAAGVRAAELTAIAVGVGPGPYTGLRVGIVTAKVMAHALGVPVYGVCGLDALARRVDADVTAFTVLTDARRKEVYWARYLPGERVAGPSVDKPSVVAATVTGPYVGPGAELYRDVLGDVHGPSEQSAVAVAELAVARARHGAPSEELRPLYLRRPDATEPAAPKPVS
ncbi:MAG: tRNA threonylcarbamoyladenosine biosynthesis protein TsaB [Frankiales bacterium]|nr:tRNA threonylcarbamoyladenosine biosynthesis protein TsaB [Frankiales bacterium]